MIETIVINLAVSIIQASVIKRVEEEITNIALIPLELTRQVLSYFFKEETFQTEDFWNWIKFPKKAIEFTQEAIKAKKDIEIFLKSPNAQTLVNCALDTLQLVKVLDEKKRDISTVAHKLHLIEPVKEDYNPLYSYVLEPVTKHPSHKTKKQPKKKRKTAVQKPKNTITPIRTINRTK
jgi:hypothetical protein